MTSRILLTAILGAFLHLAAAICNFAYAAPSQPKIKVGVSSALLGGAASYGLDIQDAVRFADEKLGKGRFELIFENDNCTGKDAVSVAQKFTQIEKVDVAIGFACSSAALSAAPIFERAKIPVLITSASSPKIAHAGEFIFRTILSDAMAAKTLYDYIAPRHASVGVISAETDYCQDFREAFEAAGKGGKLLISATDYLPNTADYKSMLLRLKSADVKSLFINSQTEGEFAQILKQAREMDWQVPIYGAYWPATRTFLEIARDSANGLIAVDTPAVNDLVAEDGKALFAEFQSKYGKPRSVESLFIANYEAFRALVDVVEAGARTPQKIQSALVKGKFNGLIGTFSFDKNGEILADRYGFVMKRVENGVPVTIGSSPNIS